MHENDHLSFLLHFGKIVKILNVIPVTFCSAEHSFGALRRLETYLRSTMEKDHLSSLALLCIERAYGNKVLKEQFEKIIDKFAEESNHAQYFF